MQFVRPSKFQEAIDKIGSKTIVNIGLPSKVWSAVPVELRDRAFFSAHVENARFLQRSKDMITDFLSGARESLPDGQSALRAGSRADFIQAMQDHAIASGMGPLDAADKGTIKDITSEARLGLIFDTQTRAAYDYGDRVHAMDPDVLDEFPAQRFIRVESVKEPRHDHAQFEDKVFLKTDPIWASRINKDFGVPWGPWGWGCGHDVEDVDRDEAESLGLIQPGEKIEPKKESLNDGLKASAEGLDSDTLDFLQKSLGDRVNFDGNTIAWKEQNEHVRATDNLRIQPDRTGDANLDIARAFRQDAESILGRVRSPDNGAAIDPGSAEENAVQIAATSLGRKPLFHEEWPITSEQSSAVVRMIKRTLPKGVKADAVNSHVYVYNPDAVKAIIEADPAAYPGTTLLDKIHQASVTGNNGELLGYGSKTMFAPGTVQVRIYDDQNRFISAFRSLGESARKFGNDRASDFELITGKKYHFSVQK